MNIGRLIAATIALALAWLVALNAWAAPYRLTYTAPDPWFGRCAATWNGVPWVLDVQSASFACGPHRCTDAAQAQGLPADVQLACYRDPNPAATVPPSALSNVIVVPGATALPGSPGATVTPAPRPTATRTATPLPATTATATVVPAPCAPIVSALGGANDYWGHPVNDPTVVHSARQLVELATPLVLCGVVVEGYGEVGATGSIAFELWSQDLTRRVDGGVASASLDVASALQPRQYVLGWPAAVTIPPGRYWLRAVGRTTGARWRWQATTPGTYGDATLTAKTSNVTRNSDFRFAVYGRTAVVVESPMPTRTSTPTRTATPTTTATRSSTPTVTVTVTPMPTVTLVFSTKTATPVPTATQTPTPQPTTILPPAPSLLDVQLQRTDGSVRTYRQVVP